MKILINQEVKVEDTKDYIDDIKKVILEVLEYEQLDQNYEISITFVSNERIRELNRDYRNIDKETDVLSFPLFPIKTDQYDMPLGDIVISLDKANEQASQYGHSLKREIMYLTCHSMLHLLGYDHMDDDDKVIMRQKEKEIMKSLGVFK